MVTFGVFQNIFGHRVQVSVILYFCVVTSNLRCCKTLYNPVRLNMMAQTDRL